MGGICNSSLAITVKPRGSSPEVNSQCFHLAVDHCPTHHNVPIWKIELSSDGGKVFPLPHCLFMSVWARCQAYFRCVMRTTLIVPVGLAHWLLPVSWTTVPLTEWTIHVHLLVEFRPWKQNEKYRVREIIFREVFARENIPSEDGQHAPERVVVKVISSLVRSAVRRLCWCLMSK